jgi:hypothetical protein
VTKVVFHLKIISRLCSHARSGPVKANSRRNQSFQFVSLFIRKKKKKSTSDVQGHIIRSLALLDDLRPNGGPTRVLPTHAEPKRRRDDLLVLGCDLPFAHDSIARSESIAGRGATPRDRILGRGLLGGGGG